MGQRCVRKAHGLFFAPVHGETALATRDQRHWKHLEENKVTGQIRKHQNPQSDPGEPRWRAWDAEYLRDPDIFDEMDLPAQERVAARGERERRRRNLARALEELDRGYERAASSRGMPEPLAAKGVAPAGAERIEGLVIDVSPGACRVEIGGSAITCGLRASLRARDQRYTNVVAVGDRVLISLTEMGQQCGSSPARGMVEQVFPRRSALVRPDVFYPHLQQVIAANIDQLLIVASWRDPAWWPELADRYLIAAERNRLGPVICLNKIDLSRERVEPYEALAPYARLGYAVLFTSVSTGEGLAELSDLLRGRTTALAGLSGVGKSSLLSAVEPDLAVRVSAVSARRHEGRHTTTQARLYPLPSGGSVVDTPGIREFGLSGLRGQDVAEFYPEISAAASECQFPDCSHVNESGCAVRRAVQAGEIAAVHYESFQKIRQSLPPQ
jgi:ribosome biogenesis GTPase